MDKKQFATMVERPEHFSSQDRAWLKAMQSKYPYSSVIAVLALLADHAHRFDTAQQRHCVGLTMCDNAPLHGMMQRATVAIDDSPFDIISEINTYQEVSFKTAPKSVILSQFLPTDSPDAAIGDPKAEHLDAGGDKKSLMSDSGMATETLAIILEKQGKPDKALAIYRKLLAQNPEKSGIFAAQIERLEQVISNK